jgi:chorismate mutase
MTRAVRGAIQVRENTRAAIEDAAVRLLGELLRANSLAEDGIISVIFSLTGDLTTGNPATGLRRAGFASVPLFCAQEPRLEGAMPKVIRALVTFNAIDVQSPVPIYLDGAEALRPDLQPGTHA